MKKTLVLYYSHTGSNRYLARRIAAGLNADIEEIRPRIGAFLLLLMRLNPGIRKIRHRIEDYGQVILVGPIWAGQVISPLRGAIRQIRDRVDRIHFVTCSGGSDEKKDHKFGYNQVFARARELAGERLQLCVAFPIPLVLEGEVKEGDKRIMTTRLNDENFKGEILRRLDDFLREVSFAERTVA